MIAHCQRDPKHAFAANFWDLEAMPTIYGMQRIYCQECRKSLPGSHYPKEARGHELMQR